MSSLTPFCPCLIKANRPAYAIFSHFLLWTYISPTVIVMVFRTLAYFSNSYASKAFFNPQMWHFYNCIPPTSQEHPEPINRCTKFCHNIQLFFFYFSFLTSLVLNSPILRICSVLFLSNLPLLFNHFKSTF